MSFSSSPFLRIYDLSGSTPAQASIDVLPTTANHAIAFSRDGNRFAMGGGSSPYVTWYEFNGTQWVRMGTLSGWGQFCQGLSWDPTGRYIVGSSYSSSPYVKVWDTQAGAFTGWTFSGAITDARRASWSLSGKYISQNYGTSFRLWDVSSGTPVRITTLPSSPTVYWDGWSVDDQGRDIFWVYQNSANVYFYRIGELGEAAPREQASVGSSWYANANTMSFAVNGQFLAAARSSSPYIDLVDVYTRAVVPSPTGLSAPSSGSYRAAISENGLECVGCRGTNLTVHRFVRASLSDGWTAQNDIPNTPTNVAAVLYSPGEK